MQNTIISHCGLCGTEEETKKRCYSDYPQTDYREIDHTDCSKCQELLIRYPEFIPLFQILEKKFDIYTSQIKQLEHELERVKENVQDIKWELK